MDNALSPLYVFHMCLCPTRLIWQNPRLGNISFHKFYSQTLAGIFGSSFLAALLLNSLHIAVTASSLLLFFISIFCLLFLKSGSCSQETHIRNKDRERDTINFVLWSLLRHSKSHRHRHRLCHQTCSPPPKKCVCRETLPIHPSIHPIPSHPMASHVCLPVYLPSRYYRIAIVKAYELESSFVFLNSLEKQKQ